jgi:hypothetical protein
MVFLLAWRERRRHGIRRRRLPPVQQRDGFHCTRAELHATGPSQDELARSSRSWKQNRTSDERRLERHPPSVIRPSALGV